MEVWTDVYCITSVVKSMANTQECFLIGYVCFWSVQCSIHVVKPRFAPSNSERIPRLRHPAPPWQCLHSTHCRIVAPWSVLLRSPSEKHGSAIISIYSIPHTSLAVCVWSMASAMTFGGNVLSTHTALPDWWWRYSDHPHRSTHRSTAIHHRMLPNWFATIR